MAERTLSVVGLGVLASWLTVLAWTWNTIPSRVPMHFGVSGRADAWGDRATSLLLPAVGTVLYAVMSVLERFPHTYNYPVRVTEQNAATLYRLGRWLVLSTKLFLVCTFAFISYTSVCVARGEALGLSPWFLPALILPLFVVTGVFMYRMWRAK
ncbi:MAG TPA: DUF1648 domain-containing protein [Polyangiaceae bacterium]